MTFDVRVNSERPQSNDNTTFLGVSNIPPSLVHCVLPWVDRCLLVDTENPSEDSSMLLRHPGLADPMQLVTLRCPVLKYGSSTGLTRGSLRWIDLESHQFSVKWLAPDDLFATSGDSGSVVFAPKEGKIMPIGLHLGSLGREVMGSPYTLWQWM